MDVTCRQAGDDAKHQKRPIRQDNLCHSCWHARKRHRRSTGRVSAVRRLYGWAKDEIDALRGVQRGRCAICSRRVGVVKQGAVDHDHAMEKAGVPVRLTVRGILCSTCNRYLGYIGDDPAVLIRGAMYLIDPPAPRVLLLLESESKNSGSDTG